MKYVWAILLAIILGLGVVWVMQEPVPVDRSWTSQGA